MSDKVVSATPSAPKVIDPIDGLVQKAVEAGSVDVLERLLTVRQQVHTDQARAAFYTALIGFQNNCPVIGKTAQANIKPGFSYMYTPIEEIAHAIRPILDAYQLGYRWFTAQDKQSLTVTCRISHALGHIEETSLTVPVGTDAMRPAWPVAQSLTYAKRYTLCNALGIVVGGEDDDAHEARPGAAQQAVDRQETWKKEVPGNQTQPAAKVNNIATPPAAPAAPVISEAQAKRLYAIAKAAGWENDELKRLIESYGHESTKEILRSEYEEICRHVESGEEREPGAEG